MFNFHSTNRFLNERYLFLLLLVLGTASSLALYPKAVGYPYQFGYQMIGLFIPPFFTGLYLYYFFYLEQVNRIVLLKSIILFFAQLIPFYSLFFLETTPYPGEDLERNMIYAKNMLANHTLWGGDELVFDVNNKSFITQPGYRYFVALELLVFQKLYRFVCVLNIVFFLVGVYFYYRVVHISIPDKKIKHLLALISLFTIPYATKNILMGLSEWLTVLLLVLSIYFYLVKRKAALSLAFLALVVFFRQNLLPPVIVLTLIILLSEQRKLINLFVFLAFLLLPVYHNLYYGNELRFFISMFNYPFLSYPNTNLPANGINYWLILNNILHYFGIHFQRNWQIDFMEESLLFLWGFIYTCIIILKKYFSGIKRSLLLVILCSVLVPTVVLATDFYPRFEFVVVYIFLISVPLLYSIRKLPNRLLTL